MRLLRRNRPFRTVIAGEFLSMLGDGVYFVALALLILDIATPQVLALSLIALGVPRGLLLLLGGAVTDRFTPRQVMLISHLCRSALVGVLTLLTVTAVVRPWHFFVISAAFGVADAFFWPASKSIIPSLVRPEDLVPANAITSVTEQITMMSGPLLGGLLMTFWGPVPALAFNTATFAIAAATVLAAPRGQRMAVPHGESAWGTVRAGLVYAWGKPGIRVVLLIVSAWTLAYSGLFGVGLPSVARTFSDPGLGLAIMVAASGAGQLIGALCAGMTGLPKRWGALIIAMAFAEAITFTLLGFVPELWLIAVSFALLGIGGAYVNDVAIPVWIQETTPQGMLGRVNSIIDIPRVTLEPVSMIAMALVSTVDARLVFIAAAIPMAIAAVSLLAAKSARSLHSTSVPSGL